MALQLPTEKRQRETILGPRKHLRDGFGKTTVSTVSTADSIQKLEETIEEQARIIGELRSEIERRDENEQNFEQQLQSYQKAEHDSLVRREKAVHLKLRKSLRRFMSDETKLMHRRALVMSIYIDSYDDVELRNQMRIRRQRITTTSSEEQDLQHMQQNIISQVIGLMWIRSEECTAQLVEYLSSEDFFNQYFLQCLEDDEEFEKRKRAVLAIDRNLRERQAELMDLKLKETEKERTQQQAHDLDELRGVYAAFKLQQEQAQTGGRSEKIPDEILRLAAEPPAFSILMGVLSKPLSKVKQAGMSA